MKLRNIIETLDIQRQIVEQGTKLAYAYEKKNKKNYDKLVSKEGGYADKLSDKKLELASVGEKNKEILYDDKGNMLFTKEAIKELNSYNKQLIDSEEEFEFYKIDYSILTDIEKEKISEIDDEEFEIISRFINNLPEVTNKI